MKIAFLGDSITTGKPGVNFVDPFKDKFPQHEFLNYGKGGDTVTSLLERLQQMRIPQDIDVMILMIGINDVYVKTAWWQPLVKRQMKQTWTKNASEFKAGYEALLDFILPLTTHLLVLSPTVVGEKVHNRFNRRLEQYSELIPGLCSNPKITYFDLHERFKDMLDNQRTAVYIQRSILRLKKDLDTLLTSEEVDDRSDARGLMLTLDGVHLNSKGASVVHQVMEEYLHPLLEEA
jgi:lysophospholipase L1-like esterase